VRNKTNKVKTAASSISFSQYEFASASAAFAPALPKPPAYDLISNPADTTLPAILTPLLAVSAPIIFLLNTCGTIKPLRLILYFYYQEY
jgi:hypothetical protein